MTGAILMILGFWTYCGLMIAYAVYATRKADDPFGNSGTRL